jgi:integrase
MTTRSRTSGQGSVYFDKRTGRYVASITLDWAGRHQNRKKESFATKPEADACLRKWLVDRDRGIPIPTGKATIAKYLEEWLSVSVAPNVRPTSFVTIKGHVRNHIIPGLGTVRLEKLTALQVQRWVTDELVLRRPGGVRQSLSILRRALRQAERWGLVARNVATLVRGVSVKTEEITPLTIDQVRAMLKAARGDALEALYVSAVFLGLRKGELLGLRWSDVDFEGGLLTVRSNLQVIEGKRVLVEPKTARSRRTVAMPRAVGAALRDHRARQGDRQLSVFVFTTLAGAPLHPSYINRVFSKILQKAELPAFRFHDLRHTAATLMLSQGVSIQVVSRILGHTNTVMTSQVYGHFYPETYQDAASRIDAVFGA